MAHLQPSSEVDEGSIVADSIYDATGQFIMPGLIEGHGHFLSYGESLLQLDLGRYSSWDDIVDAVDQLADELPPGTWIEGRGWHQEKWQSPPPGAVDGYPRHDEMSSRVPDHPVFLTHASGHAAFANLKAMHEVGMSRESADPQGGRIIKNSRGNPIGIFEENAMTAFSNFIQKTKDLPAIWAQALRLAGRSCLESGITSFQDAGSSIEQILWLKTYADSAGLPIRLWVMALDSLPHMEKAISDIRMIDAAGSFLTCRSVKSYFDGALGSRGAFLLEDYEDQPGYFGQVTMSSDYLKELAAFCTQYEMQNCVHAIGDRANREVLDIFEEALDGRTDRRWRIEHAQHIDPDDQLRFVQLGAIASMQPIHCVSDAPFVEDRLGAKRAEDGAYVWRDLIDLDTRLAIGTDVPVESLNPFENIYAAITRRSTKTGEHFYPRQSMTRQEALSLYTSGNAYAAFEEEAKGRIEAGFLADLVILDQNLMTCSDEDILQTQVVATILDGRFVFARKQ